MASQQNTAYRRCQWTTLGALASLILGLAWAVGYNTTDSALTLLLGCVLIAVGLVLGLMGHVHWLRTGFPDQGAWLAALGVRGDSRHAADLQLERPRPELRPARRRTSSPQWPA